MHRISPSCLTRIKIINGAVHSVIAILESTVTESYRYIKQSIETDGIPFGITYESTFSTSQMAKDYFDLVTKNEELLCSTKF